MHFNTHFIPYFPRLHTSFSYAIPLPIRCSTGSNNQDPNKQSLNKINITGSPTRSLKVDTLSQTAGVAENLCCFCPKWPYLQRSSLLIIIGKASSSKKVLGTDRLLLLDLMKLVLIKLLRSRASLIFSR